ncbi:two-component system response regulator [Thalassotalea insulae]|uniref:Two-component system response regulator n=1 Tax=Thalassotalea insulae TaxID=2056778 RepID=A0ABQ6GSM2_9GAMM|nr:response regulator [Thalassotalea insulae]GLX78953.1 two-component system response regulator [Thalassotalea insulae]
MIKNLNILLVEDDDVAAEAVVRSLSKVAPNIPIVLATHGKEALDILRADEEYSPLKRPLIILLDLNMPVMNGLEFLEVVRTSSDLKDLVIFVLTTSDSETDRTQAYYHNVAGYMVKSAVGPQFSKLASLLLSYQTAVEMTP